MQLFEDLQEADLQPTVVTFTSIIKACQTCGNDWRTGIEVFADMEEYGKQRTQGKLRCMWFKHLPTQLALHHSAVHCLKH